MPLTPGQTTFLSVRDAVRQRSDQVNSTFVQEDELKNYVNLSYFELYDLLVTKFEDYFVATPVVVSTSDPASALMSNNITFITLPNDFYKLKGVDLMQSPTNNTYIRTLETFPWAERYKFLSPISTLYNPYNLRYSLLGNKLAIVPMASSVYLQIWYVPRPTSLVGDNDIIDGVSGWEEYIIIDAAIKCMQKEESDISVLAAQKAAIIKRIEDTAANRDVGQPKKMSDTLWKGYYNSNGSSNSSDGGWWGY